MKKLENVYKRKQQFDASLLLKYKQTETEPTSYFPFVKYTR